MLKKLFSFLCCLFLCTPVTAQQMLTDLLDTTTALGKGYYNIYQRFDQLRITGYIQPQFQYAETPGTKSVTSGDFSAYSDNRFMLRRSRLRVDYVMRRQSDQQPVTHFVFQVDATERGVAARDIWGRLFENHFSLFSFTTGLFARPFGYEVNLSSSDRESPERGRASQLLMRTERDVGAMISFEPRGKLLRSIKWLRADVGIFNGQGLTASGDYDPYKDLIGRIYARPFSGFRNGWRLSGGLSYLHGHIENPSHQLYTPQTTGNRTSMVADTASFGPANRRYAGIDMELRVPNRRGYTELRAEYLRGQQTGTALSSETPASLLSAAGAPVPLYARRFDAAYFYFLQHLGSAQHQLALKYDWYDPNRAVAGTKINIADGYSAADVRFTTLGGGYIWYATPHLKATLWYDRIRNEETNIPGLTTDLPDNLFTARLQYRF